MTDPSGQRSIRIPTQQSLVEWFHDRNGFEYDQCDHGTYLGGPNNGQPYAMCERWAAALSDFLNPEPDQPRVPTEPAPLTREEWLTTIILFAHNPERLYERAIAPAIEEAWKAGSLSALTDVRRNLVDLLDDRTKKLIEPAPTCTQCSMHNGVHADWCPLP